MHIALLLVSQIFGLIPLNHRQKQVLIFDFVLMFIVPCMYIFSYLMATFDVYSVKKLENCNSICNLGNTLFIHLGLFVYVIDFVISMLRGKYFFPEFYRRLEEIDVVLKNCQKDVKVKRQRIQFARAFIIWALIAGFIYAIYYDVNFLTKYFGNLFILSTMAITFPLVASSIVQAQFVYLVTMISDRFNKLNFLLDTLNKECAKKNEPIQVFDIESEAPNKKLQLSKLKGEIMKSKHHSDDDYSTDSEEEFGNVTDLPNIECKTSEEHLTDLFKLHDKILNLSVLTNHEYGPQVVPYMGVCFVTSIFGIFLETKVIFVAGGRSALLDYVAHIYVIWSMITMVVAYLILRLCCNANGNSRQSAMIVHEIMQKKPPFMMGNDIFYNKMKSFTLQFLHWEGYFQFNGIGMFALDYTFIFSTVSAATSYLIVLLQFDMTEILKNEGLTD